MGPYPVSHLRHWVAEGRLNGQAQVRTSMRTSSESEKDILEGDKGNMGSCVFLTLGLDFISTSFILIHPSFL